MRNRAIGRLFLITDAEHAAARGILRTAAAALRGGVDMVQYREKGRSDYARREEINDLLTLTRAKRVPLIVNDWFDLAMACGADGVQLGQQDMSVADARQVCADFLVGCAVHSLTQARRAVAAGADYLMVGPVFPTRDENFPDAPGRLDLVREVAAAVTIPWFAAGGITVDNLPQVVAAGARRVIVCRAIMAAADPEKMAARFAALLPNQGAEQPCTL